MVRIGMVNYINTATLYEEWKAEVHNPDWRITEAPPSTLNRLLAADRLDLGIVSCYEYAARPDRYRILAGLSISANGPVGSVFLFSRVPAEELTGRLVLLTGQSETSVALVKIILEEFYGIRPAYTVGEIYDPRSYDKQEVSAVLAIGDEALRLDIEQAYPFQLDLADVWNKTTGLPFVFAVFAVRREFIRSRPETLREIHRLLLVCRDRGRKNLDAVCRRVAPRIPMGVDSCRRYLHKIQHQLDPEHLQALERFFGYLIMRGDVSHHALPLKLYPANGNANARV